MGGFANGGLVLLVELLFGGSALVNVLLLALAVARVRRSATGAGGRFALRALGRVGVVALAGVLVATIGDHLRADSKAGPVFILGGIGLVFNAPGLGALAATFHRRRGDKRVAS